MFSASGTRWSRKFSLTAVFIALVLLLGSQPLLYAGDAARTVLEKEEKGPAQGVASRYREVGAWPSIHHDAGNTDVLPGEFNGPVEFRWKWSAIENASSFVGPAVGNNGCLYFTAARENFNSSHSGIMQSALYALDQETGEILWENHEIWAAGAISSPLLIRDPEDELSIIVGCMGKVIALDENGSVLWRSRLRPLEIPISFHLTPDGTAIFLSTNRGTVYLKDPGTGRNLLPPYSDEGISNINTPAMTPDGNIILVGIHESDPEDGLAWAIRPDLLHRTWTRVWTYEDIAGASETSPALSSDGERVYLGDRYGCVIALDTRCGNQLWRYRPDPPGDQVYFSYSSLTVTPDGMVAMNLVPRDGGWESLPMYFVVLQDRGQEAELIYMKDWEINSGITYSVDSGRFHFVGKVTERSTGRLEDAVTGLDIGTGDHFSQPLENPSINVPSMGDGTIFVPICWGVSSDYPRW